MSTQHVEADYLVIGSGAMGMAFTDVLVTESDARVAIVDRHHQPGGHWNVAYPFVRLHQPSSFYGVNSRPLGNDTIDQQGWNAGLYELATNGEVCAYFDQVMQQQFLPSGRVQYFPMCEVEEGGARFRSRVSGETTEVRASKVVDATYMNVVVPSIREPLYEVAPDAHCVPINELPKHAHAFERFVVVGAGKTGMDACLFLLKHGIDPAAISWVMPRDSWMLDRALIQPGAEFGRRAFEGFAKQIEAIAAAESFDDLFDRIEAAGQLLRFDPEVRPTMYRCATVTRAELEQLRRIDDVIRMGHVKRIDADAITFDGGTRPTSPATLHVDCSADGLANRPAVPVFADDRITLQSVRTCQQVFSAAFIGHVEVAYDGDDEKNGFCQVVPHPDDDVDFLRTTLANAMNGVSWSQDPALQEWLAGARLDGFRRIFGSEDPSPETEKLQASIEANTLPAVGKLQQFIAEADAKSA